MAGTLALLVAGSIAPSDVEGVRVSFVPFAPVNPSRVAFGLEEAKGLALLASGMAWVVLSLGLRVLGVDLQRTRYRGRLELLASVLSDWSGDTVALPDGAFFTFSPT